MLSPREAVSSRKSRRPWSAVSGLALAVALGGCASNSLVSEPEPDAGSAFEQRQSVLGQLEVWYASGRLAVSARKKSLNATVRWNQNAEKYTIHLSGPLGFGGAKLVGVPGHVTLDADGKEHSATTPEALLAKVVGWKIPVVGLKFWLMGLIAPGLQIHDVRFDDSGRLEYLRQSGWEIRFLRYMATDSLDMPAKIFMDSPGLKVRIIVHAWGL